MHQVSRTVDSITLSWSQPDQPNGVILDYELQYYEKVLVSQSWRFPSRLLPVAKNFISFLPFVLSKVSYNLKVFIHIFSKCKQLGVMWTETVFKHCSELVRVLFQL